MLAFQLFCEILGSLSRKRKEEEEEEKGEKREGTEQAKTITVVSWLK